MAGKKYHTLVALESGNWAAQFGDYSRATVQGERDDMAQTNDAANLRIITSGDSQAEIDAAIAALNGVEPQPAPVAKPARVIDMTPTWESLIPAFVALIENGDSKGRATAISEMKRLAQIGDSLVAERKAGIVAEYEMKSDGCQAAGAIVLRRLPDNEGTPYVVHFRNNADSERAGKPCYYHGDYCGTLAEGWAAFASKIARYDPMRTLGVESVA